MSPPINTLALVGCSQKDESVIISLLDLLTDEIGSHWQINDRDDRSDCLLINTSTCEGKALWRSHEARGSHRIAFTDGVPPEDAQSVLSNPIRAYELVSLLKKKGSRDAVEKTSRIHPGSEVDTRFRLKRWPDVRVLRSHPEFARLSATMLRHALTVEMLADITHTPAPIVREFVETCQTRGWLLEIREVQTALPSEPTLQANRGLFSKIRARLGLNS